MAVVDTGVEKVAGADGASDVSHLLAAMQWTLSFKGHGIRAVNLWLGTDSTQTHHLSPLNAAVERAGDSGIVVTISSSHSGPGAGTVTKPGDNPLVITVGTLDDRGTPARADDVMAGFSGQGPTVADGLPKPDLLASGRPVVSLRVPRPAIDAIPRLEGRLGLLQGRGYVVLDRRQSPAGDPNIDGAGSLDA